MSLGAISVGKQTLSIDNWGEKVNDGYFLHPLSTFTLESPGRLSIPLSLEGREGLFHFPMNLVLQSLTWAPVIYSCRISHQNTTHIHSGFPPLPTGHSLHGGLGYSMGWQGVVSSYVDFALLTLWPLWWVSLILSALTSLCVE